MANQATFETTIFGVGDTVRVEQKIKEGDKERIQAFEGIVIKIKGSAENKSITVRRIATGGIGVEKIWPLSSPSLQSIKVIKKGHVRRAKLYYLRKRVGKKATRVKEAKVMASKDKKEPSVQKAKKSRENRGKLSKKASSK